LKPLEREPSRFAAAGNEEDFENQRWSLAVGRAADGDRPRSANPATISPTVEKAFCLADFPVMLGAG